MNVLITGGAGYIGSHVAKRLLESTEFELTIIDNLSNGSLKSLEVLKTIRDFEFIELDLCEKKRVEMVLKDHKIDAIIHLGASVEVLESIKNPLKYYTNNTINTINLIESALSAKVEKFLFSSSAIVYEDREDFPPEGMDEEYPLNPLSPYGASKLMSEQVLVDVAKAHPSFKYVIFRYFNVAGADINYEDNRLRPRIGQSSKNATHLIKIASECATKKREKLEIYGDDFPTDDGTGVRDYIHVDDVADAHIKALEYLKTKNSDIFNLGYGEGYSVKSVVEVFKNMASREIKVDIVPRRCGDPAKLVANSKKIRDKMGWIPKYDNLELICKSAYEWEKLNGE